MAGRHFQNLLWVALFCAPIYCAGPRRSGPVFPAARHGPACPGCGAGISSVAVAPSGDLYVCPAAIRSGEPCGHVVASLTLHNRQLFQREWSVTCQGCEALHCERCVNINKRGTLEYCVPPANACMLAHVELDAQAWLAEAASRRGLWDDAWTKPPRPAIHDPYQTVHASGASGDAEVWRYLMSFGGDPTKLTGATMLHIMHMLQGHCEAVLACREAGAAPLVAFESPDILRSLRQHIAERYRACRIGPGDASLRDVERSICRAATASSTHQAGTARRPARD